MTSAETLVVFKCFKCQQRGGLDTDIGTFQRKEEEKIVLWFRY